MKVSSYSMASDSLKPISTEDSEIMLSSLVHRAKVGDIGLDCFDETFKIGDLKIESMKLPFDYDSFLNVSYLR